MASTTMTIPLRGQTRRVAELRSRTSTDERGSSDQMLRRNELVFEPRSLPSSVAADNKLQEKYLLEQGRNNAARGQCCHTKARVCPDLRVVKSHGNYPLFRKLTAEFGGDVRGLTLDLFECCISRFGNLAHANAESHTSIGV
jgi:hypothetical protein